MENAFDVHLAPRATTPVGFGAVPEVRREAPPTVPSVPRAPTGVGQAAGSIQYVNPVRRKKWAVAYVQGDAAPRVKTLGTGFSYKQMLQAFVASGQRSQYFLYRGNGGTYLFACVYSNGIPCIKMALDGAKHVGFGRAPEGLGLSLGQFQPLSSAPDCANWVSLTPANAYSNGISPAQVSSIISTLQTAAVGGGAGGWTNVNGAYHFLYGGSSTTVGEPANTLLMKFWIDSYGNSNLNVCSRLSPAVPISPSPVIPPAVGASAPVVTGPIAPSSTDQGTYQWGTYMWQYFASNPGDVPSQPPPGQAPGAWVNTTNDGIQYDFYPGPSQLESITDPSGNTWWVYSSYHGANGSGAPADYQPPAPGSTTPPAALAGTSGSWSATIHPYYQVWIPSAAMSSTEMWLLAILGIGVLGGVAYLALD
jgi:hypothetical protein